VTQVHINGIVIQIKQTQLQLETSLQAVSTTFNCMQRHYNTHFKTVNKNICRCHPTSKDSKSSTATSLEINKREEMTKVAELSKTLKTLNDL
jgi:hypothetical protein